MKKIIVTFYDYYTEEHNKAMLRLINNLQDVGGVRNPDGTWTCEVPTDLMCVFEALRLSDCFHYEEVV